MDCAHRGGGARVRARTVSVRRHHLPRAEAVTRIRVQRNLRSMARRASSSGEQLRASADPTANINARRAMLNRVMPILPNLPVLSSSELNPEFVGGLPD